MTTSISRDELENLKLKLDKAVYKVTGYSDQKLLSALFDYVTQGYDQKKMTAKLGSLLDSRKASKLATQVASILMTNDVAQESGKNKYNGQDEFENTKKRKSEQEVKDLDGDIYKEENTKASLLTDSQIKDMMANAQKVIQERKRALNVGPVDMRKPAAETEAIEIDKQRKIQQLQAQIQSKIASGMLKTFAPSRPMAADKPTPLILDVDGKTVDVTGKEIQLSHVTPTLKANIRARKREVFKTQLNEKPSEEEQLAYFDSRIPMKTNVRNKRSLKFHEPGKFLQIAERMRMKAQLEKLQSEISLIAKKTGISSAAKLARMAPKEDREVEEIPSVEWWDSVILNDDSYDRVGIDDDAINLDAITNLVEHPTQMKPPTEPLLPVYMPVFLTKGERKKLRRQNRREAWKEEQEKIRLGLEAPPEPKMRISNLMRVLGTEAVQDPTRIEAHVRAQMAKRQKAHEEANASRKLTAEQKREKKIKKISEDTSLGVHVAVYRVSDLTNPSKKFKVEVNAKQLLMTGGVFIFRNCNLVVVEGGQKQQNKFKKLMLKRIKWEEDVVKNPDGGETNNKCVLVWEGTTKQRNFGEMKFRVCANEKIAREQLKKHGVEHYWDLAYSTSILDEK